MLDFALRVGFEARLCQPYRAQTKGKVESGVKYVRRNMWPSISFTDDADLNRQALEWCEVVATMPRVHGHDSPRSLGRCWSRSCLTWGKLPDRATLAAYLREDRGGGSGRLRQLGGPRYGVHWKWERKDRSGGTAAGHEWRSGRAASASRFIPGITSGLVSGSLCPVRGQGCPRLSRQPSPPGSRGGSESPPATVERRSLDVYELAAAGGVR